MSVAKVIEITASSPKSVEDAVRSADALMYEVKRSGKDRLLHTTSG